MSVRTLLEKMWFTECLRLLEIARFNDGIDELRKLSY